MTRWVFRMRLLLAVMPTAAMGYYSPDAGRWTTRDPLEEKGGVNLHAFCENDPVNSVDPLGKNRYMTTFRWGVDMDYLHVGVAVDKWHCASGQKHPPFYNFFFNNCIHWATRAIDYGMAQ